MLSSLFLIFAASSYFRFTASSPLHAESYTANLQSRDTYNCTDLSADPSTLCWDKLDIPDYLASWNRTTPSCQMNSGDGADCCLPSEPWTTCFLRLAYGTAGTDCSGLKPQFCDLRQVSSSLDQTIAPKVGYVVRNIVGINSLFNSYAQGESIRCMRCWPLGADYNFLALQSQGSNLLSESEELHLILGGNSEIGATLNNADVAKTLAAGLPFWGVRLLPLHRKQSPADLTQQAPAVVSGGSQQVNPNLNPDATRAFAQSLQNTKVVRSKLFGTPYNGSDDMTTQSDLTLNLGEAQNLLAQALTLIMSDVPTFTSWAAHGLYSGPTVGPKIPPGGGAGLTSAFNTYLVGAALSQSHFSATPAPPPVSKAAFQSGRTCTPLGDVCKDGSGKTYYWSQAFGTAYAVNEPKSWAQGTPGTLSQLGFEVSAYGLLGQIETSDVYMPVLFDGAYNCTLEAKAGGSAVNFKADGSLDVACLSSLPIYLAKGSSCPSGAVQMGGKCPFGFLG